MKIKYNSSKSSAWSVDDDIRALRYNGVIVFYLERISDEISLDDANDLAEYIAFLLNEARATPEQGEIKVIADPAVAGK